MILIKASVIMAEFNTDYKKLIQSIDSLLRQSFQEFEIILIDDCGHIDLGQVVLHFNDPRIRIIKNDRNRGLPYSLNRAIKESKAEIIFRMDTDDIALSNRFEKQFNFLNQNPDIDVVGSCANQLSDGIVVGKIGKPGEKGAREIMRGDSLIHPSVAFRKSSVEKVGGYPNRNRAEDLALWCELLLNGSKLFVMEDVLLNYRVDSLDYQKRRMRHRKGEIQTRLYYYPKLNAGPLEYLRIIKSIIAGILPPVLIRFYRNRLIVKNE
ncbi:putative glycosyltransferase [Corynebacterium callunae DSM 20147]|uniref:Putative glycosyltransferase n=2 Tax=Corynebacterium callunae TaxID=1721 RepID=M1UX73_9CORY|nr:putative glycosyltransferase [Corynebacterium callunae DSM 20147]